MALTHTVLSVRENQAEVQFTNEANEVHIKFLTIPLEANGDLESAEFLKIVEDHKRSLERKAHLKVIAFTAPATS